MRPSLRAARCLACGLAFFASFSVAPGSSAGQERILVIDAESVPESAGVSAEALNSAVRDEILMDGSKEYVSQKDLNGRWFPDGKEDWRDVRLIALLVIRHSAESMAGIYEKQRIWPIDSVLIFGVDEPAGKLKVHSMLANVENGRYAIEESGCTPDNIKERLRAQVKALLAKAPRLRRVDADKEVDPLNSIVMYALKSEGGEEVSLQVQYGGDRTDPKIEDVSVIPKGCRELDTVSYRLITDEKKAVDIGGTCKGGRLEGMTIVSEVPDNAGQGTFEEVLTVLSEGNYALNITMHWKNSQLKAAKIEPRANPYGEID